MTTTANFELVQLDTQQTAKEATINDAWALLDQRLADCFIHNMAADADYVLDTTDPANEHQYYLIRITDTGALLSTARTIQFPANKGPYVFHNLTAFDLNARVGGAGGFVTVGSGTLNTIYSDGTDMILTNGAGGAPVTTVPYDFKMFFAGRPDDATEILRIPFTRSVLFPLGMPLSQGAAQVAAAASTTFTFLRNGVPFATANFAAAATTATFVQAANVTFLAGDVFTVNSPTQDVTLSNVGFTLASTRL